MQVLVKPAGELATSAIVFDFDGVIVESEHIKSRAFAALYGEYGSVVAAAAVAHHEANGGISRRQKIRYLHRTLLDKELAPPDLDDLCVRFSGLVEDEVVRCSFVPGAVCVLDSCVGRLPMFVVSGTPHAELHRIIGRRNLARYFREVHGSPPEKAEIVTGILGRYGLVPDSVLLVGDAAADWRAARETGLRFVGRVAQGRESPFPPGTAVIGDLTQLVL
jgi:beta-phosphoglucomutase-like phosphatase (HAD superfamily)